ncbi:Hypothetical predicted protein [Podarcis lilfordi]|nr:Hypothetical predicted protein [Podarcis lilfordi]
MSTRLVLHSGTDVLTQHDILCQQGNETYSTVRTDALKQRYFQHIHARRILDFRHPKCKVVSYHQCFPKVSFHDWPLCPPLVRFLKSWLKVVYASSKAHQDKNGDHQIHWHKPIQEMRHDC